MALNAVKKWFKRNKDRVQLSATTAKVPQAPKVEPKQLNIVASAYSLGDADELRAFLRHVFGDDAEFDVKVVSA
jgi:hypothetical protein